MCGRYTLTSQDDVAAAMQLAIAEPAEPSEWWRPRFNIAPTQPAPVVPNRDGPRHLEMMRWGLVPPWSKDLSGSARMINARVETAATSKAFRDALLRRRCLVVADGFFEWRTEGPKKVPLHIRRDDRRPFAFAGLWERWKGPDGWVLSFTILTCAPNRLVAPVHDRMPIVLPPDAYAAWLTPGELPPAEVAALLAPWTPEGWSVVEVSPRVNSPANDDPACLEPAG
jgi:putative SOS response-associated peptidase YedK